MSIEDDTGPADTSSEVPPPANGDLRARHDDATMGAQQEQPRELTEDEKTAQELIDHIRGNEMRAMLDPTHMLEALQAVGLL